MKPVSQQPLVNVRRIVPLMPGANAVRKVPVLDVTLRTVSTLNSRLTHEA